jgi:hypothetical protein
MTLECGGLLWSAGACHRFVTAGLILNRFIRVAVYQSGGRPPHSKEGLFVAVTRYY